VEPGHHRVGNVREPAAHDEICLCAVKRTVFVKKHDLRGVHEFVSEIKGKQYAVKILSPAGGVIARAAAFEVALYLCKFLVKGHGKRKSGADKLVPFAYPVKQPAKI